MYSERKLLKMISSNKASVRYDACEWIRVSKYSSPNLVNALLKASRDEDSGVAERAKLALQSDVHFNKARKMGLDITDFRQNPTPKAKTVNAPSLSRKDKAGGSKIGLASWRIWIFSIVGVAFISLGMKMTIDAYTAYRAIVASKTWPTTTGVINSAEIYNVGGRASAKYSPEIRYSYSVAGTKFSCNIWKPKAESYDAAQETLKSLPIGTNIKVFYNPENPQICVSEYDEKGFDAMGIIIMAAGILAIIFPWMGKIGKTHL